jgi:hypothetical protein
MTMFKLLIILMAGVLALTLSEVAAAVDKDRNGPQQRIRQVVDPAAGGATASETEWEYLTALQKCESLAGPDKTNCIDATKRKYGQL